MADTGDSVLDKAEAFARRVLERLGAKVDSRITTASDQTLSPREVGDLTSRIERIIEANLRDDSNGVKRVAPNIYQVLFTYEDTSRLNAQYIEALADELKASVFEYINNRRYETRGPIVVETGSDLFSKTRVIKVSFEGEQAAARHAPPIEAVYKGSQPKPRQEARAVELRSPDGRAYHLVLKAGEAPLYIGRATGIAIRIDDPSISRLHCSLALRGNGDVVVSDLGSSNGTTVNGKGLGPAEARPLVQGDIIIVGDVSLSVSEIV
jgi:FHA domain-containing protein